MSDAASVVRWKLLNSPGPIVLSVQSGLGDHILARSAVRYLTTLRPDVYVRSSWPQLWDGILPRDRVLPRLSPLRCQAANEARFPETWDPPRVDGLALELTYMDRFADMTAPGSTLTMLEAIASLVGDPAPDCALDVTAFEAEGRRAAAALSLDVDAPFLIGRYPTVRSEWFCSSRNPAPGLIAAALAGARRNDEPVLSVAWVEAEAEEFVEADRPATHRAELGELSIEAYIWLLARARVVVSSVCNPTLVTPAVGGSVFSVFGGAVPPATIFDPRLGPGHYGFVAPEPFCACFDPLHACEKSIPVETVGSMASAFRDLVDADG